MDRGWLVGIVAVVGLVVAVFWMLMRPVQAVGIERINEIPAFDIPVEASVTMDGTEKPLVEVDDNKMGILEGLIDLTPMAFGDTIIIRQYGIVKEGGSYAKSREATYSNAQSTPLLEVIPLTAKRAVKLTAQQTAGTNRTLDVCFLRRKEA